MPLAAAMYGNIAQAADLLHQPQQTAMQAARDLSKVLEAMVPSFLRTPQSAAMQQEYDRQLQQQQPNAGLFNAFGKARSAVYNTMTGLADGGAAFADTLANGARYRAALYQKQANAGLPYQQNAGQAGRPPVPSPTFAQLGPRFYPSPPSTQQAAGYGNPYGASDQYDPSSQQLPGRQQQQQHYPGKHYPEHQYVGQQYPQYPQYQQSPYHGAGPQQ